MVVGNKNRQKAKIRIKRKQKSAKLTSHQKKHKNIKALPAGRRIISTRKPKYFS